MPFYAGNLVKKEEALTTTTADVVVPSTTVTKVGNISVNNLIVKSNLNKDLPPVVPTNNAKKPGLDDIKEPSVIIDGKVKKISKKSAFLLDMLSLDD